MTSHLEEARDHLAVALQQSRRIDDDITLNHIRCAHQIVRQVASTQTTAGWQPIDTAPKNGTKIDVRNRFGERTTDVVWKDGAWRHLGMNGFDRMELVRLDIAPAHWMPLPDDPLSTDLSACPSEVAV